VAIAGLAIGSVAEFATGLFVGVVATDSFVGRRCGSVCGSSDQFVLEYIFTRIPVISLVVIVANTESWGLDSQLTSINRS